MNVGKSSVPAVLKALVVFILDCPAATEQSESTDNSHRQVVLPISQRLRFNCWRFSKNNLRSNWHKETEIPLPVFLIVKVHIETRKKELEDTLASLGIGISQDLVMTISSQIANSIVQKFGRHRDVPTGISRKLFTVGVVDNK
ncbi:hypothetical protein PoB_005811400 [Plakobranchus ocellatus]|uniref:Uncharacterized protein n=1 Tax=Plakobranchus ocellatus TaxID=259542 RepID=A0AAV4CFY6_9GAST|nr:hypothetical protein PoB_005811400 [Plakobranchus ocellatus]